MSARLKIEGVKYEVDGAVGRAWVQLSQSGTPRLGVASGRTTDSSWQRTVAEATLNAVTAFIGARHAVALDSVMEVSQGRVPLIVVTMTTGSGREETFLSGSAPIIEDRYAAVAKAVLHGLNRRIETLLS